MTPPSPPALLLAKTESPDRGVAVGVQRKRAAVAGGVIVAERDGRHVHGTGGEGQRAAVAAGVIAAERHVDQAQAAGGGRDGPAVGRAAVTQGQILQVRIPRRARRS